MVCVWPFLNLLGTNIFGPRLQEREGLTRSGGYRRGDEKGWHVSGRVIDSGEGHQAESRTEAVWIASALIYSIT